MIIKITSTYMKIITRNSIHKIILLLCLFGLENLYSQNKKQTDKTLFGKTSKIKNANPKNGKIRCATVEYEKYLQEKNPKRMTENEFETWLTPLVQKQKAIKSNSKTAATIITIPVVVHVINNGETIGTAPNITNAQVQSQITVLNQDFRKMFGTPGYNTNPVGADVEIEFVLAKVDPNGNPTNGIDRVSMCKSSWSETEVNDIVKPATIWDPNQYMNMWTVNFTDEDLLGYAQFPEASTLPGLDNYGGAANTDGVVSSYDVFGSSAFGSGFFLVDTYDKGRTMTHEVGHWLGLKHIWGDGGSRDENKKDCNASDYCADTPQAGWENYDCITSDSCPLIAGNDMIENYMDYTNDACMNIFTNDQKTRITTIINNAARRSSLKTSTKGTAITLFANDAELKIESDYCLANVTDCSSLPTPSNKKVRITNRGTSTLSAAILNYNINGGASQSQNWTGFLAQNESAIITLANTNLNGILNAGIVSANGTTDQRASNNTDTETFSPVNYPFTNYIFTLQRDYWGSETTWELKDGAGIVKYSGGPYTNKAEGSGLPTLITQNWVLDNNQCYTFTILDSEEDGICCDGGNGYYTIKSADGTVTVKSGTDFGQKDKVFFTASTLGNIDFETTSEIFLYPNPTKETLNIQIPGNFGLPNRYTINNVLGQIINKKEISKLEDLSINTSDLSHGSYFITLEKNDQKRTLRFIKE